MIFLTLKSIANRRVTSILTIVSIALSVFLLIGVQKVRHSAKASFENTLSGTDLIVGARSGAIQLLLYSVFRIGNATNNISWQTFEHFRDREEVKFVIPLSLGDSHRGFRVIGTSKDYFEHYRYARTRSLNFAQGRQFESVFEVVLGAEVADRLQYTLGQKITLSHGISETSFQEHADKPFTIVGILAPTGTPVDRSVHVSLSAIEAIHVDWQNGAPPRPGEEIRADAITPEQLKPKAITAFFVGLHSRMSIFSVQRSINEYKDEALLAILPGATLNQLWQSMQVAEITLSLVSVCVVVAGLLGMLAAIYTSLQERRREMAILRSVGARPWQVFFVMIMESVLLASVGCIVGLAALQIALYFGADTIQNQFGLSLPMFGLRAEEAWYLALLLFAAAWIGLVPAWRAYKNSLADGLTIRV